MISKRTTVRALVATMALAGLLGATPAAAAPNTGKVAFSGGMDVTTAYFFRGILQERRGFIGQPYLEVGANVYENEDSFLRSLTLIGGTWASIHSEETGNSGTGAPALYEMDFYGGVNAGLGDYLEAGVSYVLYTSPNNAFSAVQEVDFSLGLDDSEWLGAFAMSPSALFAIETENTAFGANQGTYFAVGLEPGFNLIPGERYPVDLSFPITLGFSIDDYYEDARGDDETWGYGSFGAVASVPIAFIPEDYGSWSFTGGVTTFIFNSNLKQTNEDDTPWVVGTWGISAEY
jgi:hypothetical protein